MLVRMIEKWRKALDNSLFTGAIHMVFDYIPHDLLIPKLYTYSLKFHTVSFISYYLIGNKT